MNSRESFVINVWFCDLLVGEKWSISSLLNADNKLSLILVIIHMYARNLPPQKHLLS